ncbi:MAG: SDR family oxidoreductase [Bacteroidota bacterium]
MIKEYALVTGASKGIGKSMAYRLAKLGYSLLLVARNEGELQQIAATLKQDFNVDVHYFAIDLSEISAPGEVANWCKKMNVPLTIFINNAGYGLWGKFGDTGISEQLNMLDLNTRAVVELTHLLLPVLKNQPQSYILNVSSTAAYQAVPTFTIYAASKAFVLSFSRGLRYELKNTNISVSCLCPGPTDTGFAHRAGMDALAELAAKVNMTPDDVAGIALKGMFNKKTEIIPGFLNKLSSFGAKHLNKSLVERISAGLYKL